MKSYFCVYSNIWVTEQGLTGRMRYFSISWCFYAQKLSKICFPGSVGDMTQFFITLCILPLSCHLSIALGWDDTRKLEERQKGNHDRNPLSENISEKLHFPISQFPASAPFAARDFLIVPITSGNLEKSQIFQPSWIWRRCHQSLKRVWIKVSQTSKVCTAYKHPIQSLNLNRLFSTTLLKIILCVIWLIFN